MNSSVNLTETGLTTWFTGWDETFYDYYDYLTDIFNSDVARIYLNFITFMKYAMIIMICASLLANVLIMVVVLQSKNRKSTISIYIASLALADLLLNTGLTLNSWLMIMGYVKETYSELDCKLRMVIPHSSLLASTWTVSIIAIERAISVSTPHRIKSLCNIRKAKVIVGATWILSLFGTSIVIVLSNYVELPDGTGRCMIIPEAEEFYRYVIQRLYGTFIFVIPFIIVCTCTVIILYKINVRTVNSANKARKNVKSSVTVTLLKVNIVFVLLHGPHTIFTILESFDFFEDYNTFELLFERLIASNFFIYLVYLNSVVNFFVYFFSGSKFRKDLFSIFTINNKTQTTMKTSSLKLENITTE